MVAVGANGAALTSYGQVSPDLFARARLRHASNRLLQPHPQLAEGHARVGEDGTRQPFTLTQQAESDVLGPDVVLLQPERLAQG